MMLDEYEEFYRVNAGSEWLCGAYDEDGDQVYCEACGEEVSFDPAFREWRCSNCGMSKSRIQFFGYIGANPPGPKCISQCGENYPVCKKTCPWYRIDPSDPMA